MIKILISQFLKTERQYNYLCNVKIYRLEKFFKKLHTILFLAIFFIIVIIIRNSFTQPLVINVFNRRYIFCIFNTENVG